MSHVSDVVAPYFVQRLANDRIWPIVPLLDVIHLNPRRFSRPPADDDPVSFIPMKAVEEESGRLNPSEARPWSDVRKGYTPFEEGDVIFAKITPCMENGKYALAQGLIGGRAAGSTEFHVLRPKPSLDSKYLLYYLLRMELRQSARQSMRGAAGQLRVPPIFFEGLSIPLPSIDEQRRIVAEIEEQLSRLEAGVAALKRVQANLKRYRASVLAAACNGSLVGLNSNDCPSQTLGEIASAVRNGFAGKPDAEAGTRIFRISAVRPLTLNVDDVRYLSMPITAYGDSYVRPGDVLFTRYNGNRDLVGACAVVPSDIPPTVHPDKLIRVRVPAEILLPGMLALLASAGEGRYFLESRIRTTAGQSGISGSDLKALPLRLPPQREQELITAELDRRLSVVEEIKAQVHADLLRAERLRQVVLHQAFMQPCSESNATC